MVILWILWGKDQQLYGNWEKGAQVSSHKLNIFYTRKDSFRSYVRNLFEVTIYYMYPDENQTKKNDTVNKKTTYTMLTSSVLFLMFVLARWHFQAPANDVSTNHFKNIVQYRSFKLCDYSFHSAIFFVFDFLYNSNDEDNF